MGYLGIDPAKVVETLEALTLRIVERFPDAGLVKVCGELTGLARITQKRVSQLARPILPLRLGVAATLLGGLGLAIYGGQILVRHYQSTELFSLVSGLESVVNLLLITGTGVFLLTNIEARYKRHKSMQALHELRSIIHVIDMHQLTKDPSMLGEVRTSNSPDHNLTPFQLVRYLDYCSEMLSLTGKLAALYAQDFNDGIVVEAASDIEQLATNLSQKVWQKITIIQSSG
jgi:hypothetical protein